MRIMTEKEIERVNYELECLETSDYIVQQANTYENHFVDMFGDIVADNTEILCECRAGRFYVITRDEDNHIVEAEEVEIR